MTGNDDAGRHSSLVQPLTAAMIAGLIDHAVLAPTATLEDVAAACSVGASHQVASVCVRPSDVAIASALLHGSPVRTSTVIGFPHGTTSTAGKLAEAEQAWRDGAAELDMVLNIGRLLSGDEAAVEQDITDICRVCRQHGLLLKVIFETCYLTDTQKITACRLCTRAGVDFVKTSTGFGSSGATATDVHLLRQHVPASIGVKASGGIRSLDAALVAMACGATRLGTSSTEKIIAEAVARQQQGTLHAISLADALQGQSPVDPHRY